MAEAPDAAGSAPAPQTEQTPITTNEAPAAQIQTEAPQAPDMHGFTSDQLADIDKFFKANGGFDAIKSKISNPEPKPAEQPQPSEPTSQPQKPTEPEYKTPAGAVTRDEFFAKQYFKDLASEEQFSSISDKIANGDYLQKMSSLGIQAFNPDGSINDARVREFMGIMAQTVPATPTSTEPSASPAPTVTYTEVGENGIADIDQAYKILMEKDNPAIPAAEKYIREKLNPDSSKK